MHSTATESPTVAGTTPAPMCMVAGPLPERRRSEPPKPPKYLFRFPQIRRVSIGPSASIEEDIPAEVGGIKNIPNMWNEFNIFPICEMS